jgi:hypothetical protein
MYALPARWKCAAGTRPRRDAVPGDPPDGAAATFELGVRAVFVSSVASSTRKTVPNNPGPFLDRCGAREREHVASDVQPAQEFADATFTNVSRIVPVRAFDRTRRRTCSSQPHCQGLHSHYVSLQRLKQPGPNGPPPGGLLTMLQACPGLLAAPLTRRLSRLYACRVARAGRQRRCGSRRCSLSVCPDCQCVGCAGWTAAGRGRRNCLGAGAPLKKQVWARPARARRSTAWYCRASMLWVWRMHGRVRQGGRAIAAAGPVLRAVLRAA